jgi:hypothetical protein
MQGILNAADNFFRDLEGKKVTKAAKDKSNNAFRKDMGSLGVALITSIVTTLFIRKLFDK